MAKEKKRAIELADMVQERMTFPTLRVDVYKDAENEWLPIVVAATTLARRAQLQAEAIARELRTIYDVEE